MDWDFWKNNKDTIETIFTVIGGLIALGGVIWAVFKWGVSRWWVNRVRGEVKVFELITDPTTLLSKLYATENDNSPLADHNIKYQPRDPKRDIQAELKAALNRSRYLLVTAPTGYGKTREAGMLAQTMMLEGWRVLRIRTGWLDMPKTLPEELGGNRSRVLIFLDDLNGLFSTGNLTQSPRVETEKSLLLSQASYHDRLLQVLDMFEGMCTESEIRVIATARSEEEQWKVLEFNQYDRLWKRFERVELPEPLDSAIVNLLEDTTKQADIKGNESEFEAIARKSDGTYRNILLNLRRWRSQNGNVNTNDFTETLNGSWQDIYERAVKKHPAVRYVYDAIYILNQARIELFLFLVEPTAVMLWGGNYFQRLLNKRKISRAIHYLTKETTILKALNGELNPSDGQVEVNKDVVSWNFHSQFLFKLLLGSSNKNISASIYGLAVSFDYDKQFEYALELIKKYVSINPSDSDGQIIFGNLLDDLKRYIEAEAAYRKAIELDPQGATAYFNLGILLKKQKRFNEAEAAYRKAIELTPQYANAYNNLGNTLNDLKRYDEAEAAYCKAIELNPQDAYAYNNLGNTLNDLKRYDEAEAAYRKAIELDPQYATAYNNLGILLKNLKRYDEAEANYRKAIELDPKYANAYNNLGNTLNDLKRYDEAEAAYRKAIELNPQYADAYNNLGSLLYDLKRYDEAEANYRKAIELDSQDATVYNNSGILLKNLKRYDEAEAAYCKAIELDPQYANAYNNLGNTLNDLKRYDEAEVNYRKAIELDSQYAPAYNNLGSLLYDLKRYDEAEANYRKAIELDPQYANAYNNLGNTLNDLKRYDEAEVNYRKAIELDPKYATAYNNLGNTLNDLKRYDEAEVNYRKAIELNLKDATAYFNLGSLLDDLKRYDEAEVNYRKAIELNPQYANAYNNLGNTLNDLKRYDEAEANYRKAIELNPQDAYAYNNLGSLLYDLKRYDEAEAAYRKAIELNPQYATAYNNLGILLKNLKRYDEAEANYRKAIELNPEDTDAYDNLVRLLRFNFKNRLEETLPLLEKMIEIDPENFDPYLAVTSVNKELGNSVLPKYLYKANQLMPADDWYNRACLESVRDNFDLAFDHLRKAAQKEEFNPKWAWEDPDLQWIRNDQRFAEIVGPKPE